ncbi:MAG TPA: hypothetical protein VIL84_07045 [Devosiaceae bacterium]
MFAGRKMAVLSVAVILGAGSSVAFGQTPSCEEPQAVTDGWTVFPYMMDDGSVEVIVAGAFSDTLYNPDGLSVAAATHDEVGQGQISLLGFYDPAGTPPMIWDDLRLWTGDLVDAAGAPVPADKVTAVLSSGGREVGPGEVYEDSGVNVEWGGDAYPPGLVEDFAAASRDVTIALCHVDDAGKCIGVSLILGTPSSVLDDAAELAGRRLSDKASGACQ